MGEWKKSDVDLVIPELFIGLDVLEIDGREFCTANVVKVVLFFRNALEGSSIAEAKPRSCHQVLHRTRNQHLACVRDEITSESKKSR